jgi:hypothetical protein
MINKMNNKICCTHVWDILLSIRENMIITEVHNLYSSYDYIFCHERMGDTCKLFGHVDTAYRTGKHFGEIK